MTLPQTYLASAMHSAFSCVLLQVSPRLRLQSVPVPGQIDSGASHHSTTRQFVAAATAAAAWRGDSSMEAASGPASDSSTMNIDSSPSGASSVAQPADNAENAKRLTT